MKNKIVVSEKVEEVLVPEVITPVVKINPFSGEFGRVDLNQLRDKLNEVIDFINKQ